MYRSSCLTNCLVFVIPRRFGRGKDRSRLWREIGNQVQILRCAAAVNPEDRPNHIATSMGEKLCRTDATAFIIEYDRNVLDRVIHDELKSYLAEYRFKLPQYRYDLEYFDSHLRDPYTHEPMIKKAERAIELRRGSGKNISREIAEYQGIEYLDDVLQNTRAENHHIIWASPPGRPEDGYGNYGFIYVGEIDNRGDSQKHISMTAYRIEESSVGAYNEIMSRIVNDDLHFNNPEEFLAHPILFDGSQINLNGIIQTRTIDSKINNKQFELIMGTIDPLIKQFIYEVNLGSPKERLRQLFYTIEHLVIQLQQDSSNLYSISKILHTDREFYVQQLGNFRPPIVGGSCGSSGGDDSIETLLNRNIMNRLTGHILSKILGDGEGFECPKCHYRTKEPVGNQCPSCSLTKDQAAKLGYATC